MSLDLILVGYLLKNTVRRPDWLKAAGVEEICSVSGCISSPPDGYLEAWTHNGLCLFDSVDAARAAADQPLDTFDVYAFKLAPISFTKEGERAIPISELPDFAGKAPDPDAIGGDFVFLGYDCAQTEWDRRISGFGCSPLSCNGMAAEIAVNRHCLLDDLDAACDTARRFALRQPEPGVYYVIEVWRQAPILDAVS